MHAVQLDVGTILYVSVEGVVELRLKITQTKYVSMYLSKHIQKQGAPHGPRH